MEPLTFKIITDADDRGVRTYEKSLGQVDLTGRKASGALKGFIQDLGQAQSTADVTSSALNAMARILGTSIGATAVVVVGKALVDAFLRVNEAVKESTKSVEEANKEIAKIAMAGPSFETASKQADTLNKTVDQLRKNLEKINESKLQGFIAGLTGSKEKIEELITVTQKQADDLQRQAIAQKLLELERNATLDETTKKIAAQQKPYQELAALARQLGDIELQNAVVYASQADVRRVKAEEQKKAELAAQEEVKKAEEARIKERNKMEEEAAAFRAKLFDAEEEGRKLAYEIEAQFIADLRQKEVERIREIEKQLESINERKKAIEEEIALILQRNAAESAGAGGTSRGPGQLPTSFEVGLEEKLLRERYKAIRERDEEYFEFVRAQLKLQGQAYDNDAVRREIARRAVEEQTKQIMAGNEKIKELKAEYENLKEANKKLQNETDALKKSIENASKASDEISQSFKDSSKEFTIEGKNMVDGFLKTTDGVEKFDDQTSNAELSLADLDTTTSLTTQALDNFKTKLDSVFSGIEGGDNMGATEATLMEVLTMLTDTLNELKSYAHAGAGT